MAVVSVVVVTTVAVSLLDYRLLVVRSGSMSPAIDTGSLAIARPFAARQVEVGDVVTVPDDSGVLITHRVVDSRRFGEQATLTLQGDANPAPDQQRYVVSRVHRVAMSIPWLGYVVDALTGPRLAGASAAIALALLIGSRRRRHRRRGRDARHRGLPPTGRLASSRVLLVMATVVVLGGVIHAVQGAVGTWAAYSDSARLGSGSFTATTVVPPTDVTCVDNGSQDFIRWTPPPGPAPTTYRIHVNGSTTVTAEVGSAVTQWRPASTLFPQTHAAVRVVAVRGTWTSVPSATTDSISTLFLFQGTSC